MQSNGRCTPCTAAAPTTSTQLVGPRSYREFYTDTANDPWAGNYATLMAQYAMGLTNMLKGLLTRMLAYSPSTPQAFIMLEAWQDTALVD